MLNVDSTEKLLPLLPCADFQALAIPDSKELSASLDNCSFNKMLRMRRFAAVSTVSGDGKLKELGSGAATS